MSNYGYIDERTWAAGCGAVIVILLVILAFAFWIGRCSAGYTVKVQSPVVTERTPTP